MTQTSTVISDIRETKALLMIFRLTFWASIINVVVLTILIGIFRSQWIPLAVTDTLALCMFGVSLLCLWLLGKAKYKQAISIYILFVQFAIIVICFSIQYRAFIVSVTMFNVLLTSFFVNRRFSWLVVSIGVLSFSVYTYLDLHNGINNFAWVIKKDFSGLRFIQIGFTAIFMSVFWLTFRVIKENIIMIISNNIQQIELEQHRYSQGSVTHQQLQAQYDQQERFVQAIKELGVPLISIRNDARVLPLVGTLGKDRWLQISETVLQTINQTDVRLVLVDLTNVERFEMESVKQILELSESVRLLGGVLAITGIGARNARLLAEYDFEQYSMRSFGSIIDALEVYT